MKKSEIVVGGIYHNGGDGIYYKVREVIDEGPKYILYPGQRDCDCVKYQDQSCKIGFMTRTRFAAWAKGRIGEV